MTECGGGACAPLALRSALDPAARRTKPTVDMWRVAAPPLRGFFNMASVSPLAPAKFPDMPTIAGVALSDRGGRHPLPGPHRRPPGGARRGHDRRRRVHALEVPVGAGGLVPRQPQGQDRPRRGGEFRQRQRLHGQGRQGGDQVHRRARRQGGRLQARPGLPRLHRGHRRALEGAGLRDRDGHAGRHRDARPLGTRPPRRS